MKEKYTIRRADISEIGMVMRFLHDYWKPTFILSQSEQFMRWQHVYEDEFCYLIAQNGRTGEIDGLIGYIPYSNSIPRDIFGALWKVKDDASPGLGLRMRLALSRMPGTRSLSAIGLNPNTLNLHRRCGSMVDSLKHYYILSDIDRFRIAQIEIRPNCLFNNSLKQYSLVCTKSIEKIGYAIEIGRAMGRQPYKSLEFIIHRYINHPIYKYMLYSIEENTRCRGIYVIRAVEAEGSRALRIIDYLGDVGAIAHTGLGLRELIKAPYEYLDFYEYGIPDDIMVSAGFVQNRNDGQNIIPDYFEPFERRNVKLDFFTDLKEPFCMFKGDGDQDRPSIMQNEEG